MTETRKWTVGAALVAVLVLVAGWFLLISPKRGEVADLQAQTEQQQSQNGSLQTQIAVLKQQNKDLPEKQAELAALQTKIPSSPNFTGYIRELQDIGDHADVELVSMSPSAAVTLGQGATDLGVGLTPDALAAVDVSVVVSGEYLGIERFMNELETAERYTLVSGFTIAEAEDTGGGSTPGSADLTGTINARIYLVPTAPELATGTTTGTTATPAPTPTPSS